MNKIQKIWDLIFVLSIFWAIMLYYIVNSLLVNQGIFVYPVDDAYIHMAISKNIAQHGIWGIDKYDFTSNSSSILYVLILSFSFIIGGVNEIIPLILNLFFANLLICIIYKILKNQNIPSYGIILGLSSIIIFIPLMSLVVLGMEFVLQIMINIVFIFLASNYLCNEQSFKGNKVPLQAKLIILIAPLVTMIRFEGMFIIITVSIIFSFRKKVLYALIILTLGFSPIIIYGIISILNGWFFFPNSIILKGRFPNIFDISGIFFNFYNSLLYCIHHFPYVFILLVGMSIIFCYKSFVKKDIWNESSIMSIIFIIITLFQIQFAALGYENFYILRYDPHLIALGIFTIVLSIKDNIPSQKRNIGIKEIIKEIKLHFKKDIFPQLISIFLIIFIFLLPLIYRADYILKLYPQSAKNVYEQQYQMGLFLKEYYEGECIAANDVGAINFIADIKCIDLWGLCNMDMAFNMLNKTYNFETISRLLNENDCKITIIYGWWFSGIDGWPPEWVRVGDWTIKGNVVCGGDTVSFYAVDPLEVDNLISNLKEFSSRLPDDVLESGMYTLN